MPAGLEQQAAKMISQHPNLVVTQNSLAVSDPTVPVYAPMPIGSQRPGASRYGMQLHGHGQPHDRDALATTSSLVQPSLQTPMQTCNNNGMWGPGHGEQSLMKPGQHLLFQPGPSTLEKLLQQNRQSNK